MYRIPDHIRDPNIRITVRLIGAGGTGSHLLESLAQINLALYHLGHPGLYVEMYDMDRVEEYNIGRQKFGWNDIGRNKADALIARANRMYGLDWDSTPTRYEPGRELEWRNITITAVDNGRVRNEMQKAFKWAVKDTRKLSLQEHYNARVPYFWLDIGNGDKYGQFVLGGNDLPTSVDMFGKFDEQEDGPSCSALESLGRQDLFINKALAVGAGHLLWNLFRKQGLRIHGGFMNLETFKMSPIAVPERKK